MKRPRGRKTGALKLHIDDGCALFRASRASLLAALMALWRCPARQPRPPHVLLEGQPVRANPRNDESAAEHGKLFSTDQLGERFALSGDGVSQWVVSGTDVPMTDGEPKAALALKARLLADLVRAKESGHVLQATTVAVLLDRNPCDLVNQSAGITVMREGMSVDERLQMHLRNVVTVLSVAERHLGDVLQALHWYLTDQPAQGAQQTPEAMIAAGRLEDAYRRLFRAGGSSSQP